MPLAPFIEAVTSLRTKQVLPTVLDSAALRQMDAGLRRRSFFSATNAIESSLDEMKRVVESVINPVEDERGVLTGYNPATAREAIREKFRALGYEPEEGTEGRIKDLSSDARINLVVKTQSEMAQGAGQFVQQNAYVETLDAFPALELYRLEARKEERDWPMRWRLCAQVVGDVQAARVLDQTGRMCALKSSRIWQALGDGEDGSMDTLGNPYPPFAFNSGMWTEELDRQQAVDLGLIGEQDRAQPAAFAWGTIFDLEDAA